MSAIYKGPGNSKDYDHSLEFLDYVFFSEEENPRSFIKLLPKLYKKEYNHCENNLIVSIDGKWKGAVGLYFDDVDVMGNRLVCGGIGNVAVDKDCRGEGYMQDCMQMSMDRIIQRDADFSVLGGQRQRYGYFSFAPAGYEHHFTFNKQNLKHVFGSDYSAELEGEEVSADNREALAFIKKLYESNPDKFIRPDDKLYDYLKSWRQRPFIFKEDGKPVAYCVFDMGLENIVEIKAINTDYFKKLIPSAFVLSGNERINLELPLYEKDYIEYLSQVAEGHSIDHSSSLTVLNWKRFVKAYFELKASYTPLCDGSVSFLIHGYKKDEAFTLTVKDGKPGISDEIYNPIELTHHEAVAFFFSLYSIKNYDLPAEIAPWFPLHWYIHPSDKV